VTKLPEVVQGSAWGHRQKAATAFLSSIGTDEDIKKIMGVRYADVAAAINGTTPFGATTESLVSAATTQKASAFHPAVDGVTSSSHPGPSSSGIASSSTTTNVKNLNAVLSVQTAPALQVAGKKRKDNPAVNLGFIDLT